MISHEQSLFYILTSSYYNLNHHQPNQQPNHHHHHHNNQQHSYNHSTNRISFVMLIVSMVFLIIFSELQLAHSNPVPSTKGSDSNGPNGPAGKLSSDDLRRECYPGSDLRDLCEMCAKVTRNANTFSWCCTHQFNVTDWCVEYLSYTIGPNK